MKHENFGKILLIAAACLLFPMTGDAAKEPDPAKELLKAAKTIDGDDTSDAVVSLEFNRDYKLAQHQKKGGFDYFRVHLQPNTVVTLEVRTFEKGIAWNPRGRPVTTGEPFAGLQLIDSQKNVLGTAEIAGRPNAIEKVSWRNRSAKEGEYLIRVGSSQGSMPKGQAVFKVTVSPFVYGDLGTAQDAGSTAEAALPIIPMRRYQNSLGGGDPKDVYAFSAAKKEHYSLAIRGEDPIEGAFKIAVRNASEPKTKRALVSFISGGKQQVVTNSFKIPKDGEYVVEISPLLGPLKEKSLYSLELLKVTDSKGKQISSEDNQ